MDESILKTSGGSPIRAHSYNLNLAGWKTQQTLPDTSTVDYDYDNIGQLIDADASGGGIDFSYLYDDAWNLDERDINTSTEYFNVNSQNELTSSPLGTPVYDDNGNMTDDGRVEYEYNAENQLVFRGPIDLGGLITLEITYVYDGLGRLRKKIEDYYDNGSPDSTVETRYIYDGRLVIEERNGSNVPLAHYVRGVDLSGSMQGAGGIGGLLAREWGANTGYYHADAQGNVTAMINSSGTVNASYHYDSFGNTLSQSGSWALSNPYRFSSKRIDYSGSQGIYYYGYRFYHSDLQRWINRDPIGEAGGINLYGFVGNDPNNLFDPWGHDTFCQNRQLNPDSLSTRDPVENPISHTFVFTTNPDGTLKDTYSWGNSYGKNGNAKWHKNAPEDVSAAKKALKQRKKYKSASIWNKLLLPDNFGEKVGGASLDPFIESEFNKRLNNPKHPSYHPWKLFNNCKHEAQNLIDDALKARLDYY